MKKNELLRAALIMVVTTLVFVGAMIALNLFTGPLIEQNNQGAELAPLKAVMPDAEGFENIYDAANPSASSLKDVDAVVLKIYKETSGKGFVFRVSATSQYSKEPMEYTVGVTSDGKITKIQNEVYTDSLPLKEGFLTSFEGKDSALAGVEVTGGTTYSSTATKNSIEKGMAALINNDLIKEGVKSDSQILTELIATVFPGITANGTLKAEQVAASGNIELGYKGLNGAGFAFVMKKADASFLAICNNLGACKVYNVEGADVTADNADLVTEALAAAGNNGATYQEKATTKFTALMPGAANFASVSLEVFNSVVSAVEFDVEGTKYYGFYSKSFGYEIMDVFYVLDSEGKIVKMTANTFIFEEEYFFGFAGLPSDYKDNFVGLTGETFDGSQAIIATATLSSNAMKQSTNDIFAAFEAVKAGGAE